jgi:L-lactate dehydrogenase
MLSAGRLAIIGAGHVGSTTAFALMLRALVREIVLVDENVELADAEARDLTDANALARPAKIWAGTYEEASKASIAILTAGAATHGAETRLSIASSSAHVVGKCVGDLKAAGFDGILIVASNPVDLMALVALRESGLPIARVLGTGTLLDSSRFQQVLATRFNLASAAVEATVIGEHGDSQVASFSTARVGGVSLDQYSPISASEKGNVAQQVSKAAYRIIEGKGYTSFGIATATVRICEAILRNERTILPVSTMLTGQFGIEGVFLSLPCVLGGNGVEAVIMPSLSDEEQAALYRSAEMLRSGYGKIAHS